MTDAERRLWSRLRRRQLHGRRFRRQHPIGPFIADFACPEEKLVIELDGGQHADRKEQDAARTRWLAARGYRVLRFWNNDVLTQTDAVVQVIAAATRGGAGAPLPNPPPASGASGGREPEAPFGTSYLVQRFRRADGSRSPPRYASNFVIPAKAS
jgi:very-short-patch-repair endonuclease